MISWSRKRFCLLAVRGWVCAIARINTVGSDSQMIVKTVIRNRDNREKAGRFIDYKRVYLRAGNGGDGLVSFLSLYANEFAGPDGGDAGNGGHIIFQANKNVHSLIHLKSQYVAEAGANGRNKNRAGKNADHLHLTVPIGTVFKDENHQLVADLSEDNSHFIGARGGGGGKGNSFFTSSTNTAPTMYEEGGKGQERTLHIELKVIAHIGLVGFPNAGKSTLLRALSKARPKVAAYPFTTLRPHVGIIEYKDHEQVRVADIPGLIAGAHQDRGLGISFLKHIERCVCLLFVIDLSSPDSSEQLDTLKYELEQYKEGLSCRPHAVVANKTDLPMAENNLEALRSVITKDIVIFPISATEKTGIKPLVKHIREFYDREHDI